MCIPLSLLGDESVKIPPLLVGKGTATMNTNATIEELLEFMKESN
jgi:hypothetical protein